MTPPHASPPTEIGPHPVGHRSLVLFDPDRSGRRLDVEVWYPAAGGIDELTTLSTTYEVLPDIAFSSGLAQRDAVMLPGRHPLMLLSHGRTGTRFVYSTLCESLASFGLVVVAPDHPGDVMTDWLSGRNSDDRTNEIDRVADAHLVLAALLHGDATVPADLTASVDADRVVAAGHSYGAYTAFAAAAGARGVEPHDRVRAVVGLQAYTRTTSDGLLGRVAVPALLVVSEQDRTTPPVSDAERPWALLPGAPVWRLDLPFVGHHASSDICLYAELVDELPNVPDILRQYLTMTATEAAPPGAPPWRATLAVQVRTIWAFLQVVLGLDPEHGAGVADAISDPTTGVNLRRR